MLKYTQNKINLQSKKSTFSNIFNKSFSDSNFISIKVSTPTTNVGLIQLFRPKSKNALNSELIRELNIALNQFDIDTNIGCVVLGGDKDYFAAGADIKEMKDKTFSEVYGTRMLDDWNKITSIK
jgi:enoyl-CoA hydratase